jgi:hypothetical protein
VVKPVKRREVVRYLMNRYSVGLRRACRCARIGRSSYRYTSCRDPLNTLANACVSSLTHALDSVIGAYSSCFDGKAGIWVETACIAFTAKKAWVCGASDPGAMCRRFIEKCARLPDNAMMLGVWTLSRISWPTAGVFKR